MDAAVNHQWLEEERVARPELLNIAVTPDEELTEHMKLVTDV